MSTSTNRCILGAAAATLAGIPTAAAGFLRLKYGPTVFADLVAMRQGLGQLKQFKALQKENFKVVDFFEVHAKETPDKECVLYKDEVHTYGDLDREANKFAHFVQRRAVVACMDTVAIFMMNEPSFVISWLAFAKLGLRIALLNYNLRGGVLLHCIKVCNVKVITCGNGLPKPVKEPNSRQVRGSFIQARLGLSKDDVQYTPLPLYHSGAIMIGFFNVLRVGGTTILSDFSARRFWDDVRRYRATVIQYIGETCRYLVAQPRRHDDGKYSHKIRYAIGNGLSPDIWEEFQMRFNIGHIAEFYGASEATYMTMNMDGKVGSVGRYHGIFKALTDIIVLVQCDIETAQPLRGRDDMCIITSPGETGLMLFRIDDNFVFHGYMANKSEQKQKIVRNVKRQGDVFYNSGDLMVEDKDGYLYFKDRLGDTFRWKGENVATTEVAYVLNLYSGIREANVYGVKVPGHDGRVGMAAIVLDKECSLDPKFLYDHVVRSLPLYACPKFLRIMKEMDITGTFKHKKTDLAKEGFDPNVISDPLFFMDMEKKTYAPLDIEAMRMLVIGQARL